MEKVLVISETLHHAEEIHRIIASSCSQDITFRYPEILSQGEQDLVSLFKDCCQVIREENISAVLSLAPRHVLLHAALRHQFPMLKGPSFEAAFLCIHRYYSKELICNGFNPMYRTIEMEELTSQANSSLASVFDEVESYWWVRDSCKLEGTLVKKVKRYSQFRKELKDIKAKLKISHEKLMPLLMEHLDRRKYPSAFEPSCTVEQYLALGKQTFSFHYVEGCVADQKVIPWAISDIHYLKQKPKRVQYVCVPSRVSESTQYQIWGVYREVAQRLLSYGFDNQFLYCEVLVTKSGDVKIVDIVPSVNKDLGPLYRQVYQGGDNIKAQIEVGLGVLQWSPRPLPQRAAMLGRVYITKSGVRLGDVIDTKKAKSTPNVHLVYSKDDQILEASGDDGSHLMNVITYDKNIELCLKKNREVTSELLLKSQHVGSGFSKTKDS